MSSRRSRSGGSFTGYDVDPVVQVFPEAPLGHHFSEVLVRRGNDADVGFDFLEAADAPEAPLLQHAQQLDLHHLAHLPDFIEEDGAALRGLDQAPSCWCRRP